MSSLIVVSFRVEYLRVLSSLFWTVEQLGLDAWIWLAPGTENWGNLMTYHDIALGRKGTDTLFSSYFALMYMHSLLVTECPFAVN